VKTIVWQADYLPFGDIYQTSGTASLNFRFPGQYQDRTNLYQNGFRDYNPKVGRYVEADPILQSFIQRSLTTIRSLFFIPSFIKSPNNFHPYNYVNNNSVNLSDPLGLAEVVHAWYCPLSPAPGLIYVGAEVKKIKLEVSIPAYNPYTGQIEIERKCIGETCAVSCKYKKKGKCGDKPITLKGTCYTLIQERT